MVSKIKGAWGGLAPQRALPRREGYAANPALGEDKDYHPALRGNEKVCREDEKLLFSYSGDGSDELMQVVGVKKLNGKQVGKNEYLVDVECNLRFKVGLKDVVGQMQGRAKNLEKQFETILAAEILKEEYGSFKASKVREDKGSYLGQPREKWLADERGRMVMCAGFARRLGEGKGI